VAVWRTSNVVGHFNEVTVCRVRLVLGWVTIFGWANHLSISSIHPGQHSLPPSAGRETSTSQSAVMLCGWAVKAVMVAHSTCGWACRQQVKLCDPTLTHALPEQCVSSDVCMYMYVYMYPLGKGPAYSGPIR